MGRSVVQCPRGVAVLIRTNPRADAPGRRERAQHPRRRARGTAASHAGRGRYPERREPVALILDSAPITRERAETRLGYRLNDTHTAAIVWTGQPTSDPRQLERVTEALGKHVPHRPLSVLASAATRWVWLPGT